MKKLFFLVLLIGVQVLIAQNLIINEKEASVSFLFLDDDVDGTLSDFKFTGKINLDDLENSSISGTVATKTIDTDNWLRNRHLRNKYFMSDDFPKLSFESTAITSSEEGFIAKGNLTIKDRQHLVSFHFSKTDKSLKGAATINASLFNIKIHDELSRNKVEIVIVLPYNLN